MAIQTPITETTEILLKSKSPSTLPCCRFMPQDPGDCRGDAGRSPATGAESGNAVILAHNYQVPEVQDVADFVGDSLGMAIEAKSSIAPVIVVCGVYFMAETAKILNPERTVLIPGPDSRLLAGQTPLPSSSCAEWKAEHPGAVVVSYVNTTAADQSRVPTTA